MIHGGRGVGAGGGRLTVGWWRWCALVLALVTLGGCAASRTRPDYDPLEPLNRKIFWFNDTLDIYAMEPAATAWQWVVPDLAERSLSNFFANVLFPIEAGNCILQLKPVAFGKSAGRFVVNTTVGVVGLFDPATGWGLERQREDFGQTLGYWGLAPGAYVVLPVLGPSNPRDMAGLVGDYLMSVYPFFIGDFWFYATAATAVNFVNARAQFLEEIKNARSASLDYYTFVRNAYFQRRRALINDSTEPPKEDTGYDDDLYQIED